MAALALLAWLVLLGGGCWVALRFCGGSRLGLSENPSTVPFRLPFLEMCRGYSRAPSAAGRSSQAER